MKLNVQVDEHTYQIDVPEDMLQGGMSMFKKMDSDMDKGWQMGREWIRILTPLQRCQVVADRLLTAIENKKQNIAMMMSAYILYKLPATETIVIDTQGEMLETQLVMRSE